MTGGDKQSVGYSIEVKTTLHDGGLISQFFLCFASVFFLCTYPVMASSAEDFREETLIEQNFQSFASQVYRDFYQNQPTISDDRRNYDDSSHLPDSSVSISTDWENKVKTVVSAYLFSQLEHTDDLETDRDVEFEQFVENIYVEIQNFGGYPVVLILEQQDRSPFGQRRLSGLIPVGQSDIQRFNHEVIGATLDIPLEQTIGILDGAEISIYKTEGNGHETTQEDLGFAVRLRKQVGQVSFVASALQQKNIGQKSDAKEEKRISASVRFNLTNIFSLLAESRFYENSKTPIWNRWGKGISGSSYFIIENSEQRFSREFVLSGQVNQTDRTNTRFGLLTSTLSENIEEQSKWGFELIHTINKIRKGYQWSSGKFATKIKFKIRKREVKVSLSIPIN